MQTQIVPVTAAAYASYVERLLNDYPAFDGLQRRAMICASIHVCSFPLRSRPSNVIAMLAFMLMISESTVRELHRKFCIMRATLTFGKGKRSRMESHRREVVVEALTILGQRVRMRHLTIYVCCECCWLPVVRRQRCRRYLVPVDPPMYFGGSNGYGVVAWRDAVVHVRCPIAGEWPAEYRAYQVEDGD